MEQVNQGTTPDGGKFYHFIRSLDGDVTHLLTVVNGQATLHKILATGEVVSQALDIPALKQVIAAVESVLGPQG